MVTRLMLLLLLVVPAGRACAQPAAAARAAPRMDVLTEGEWRQVDGAIDGALVWLASQQKSDGSLPTIAIGQPAVTSLGAMAFLSRGHLPGLGPYGRNLDDALDYVLASQRENGLLARVGFDGPIVRRSMEHDAGVAGTYNHAISGLMLSEAYAMSPGGEREPPLREAIRKALDVTLTMQKWPKQLAADHGGWRYLRQHDKNDSDLSVVSWHLMFLRSAKNAGFDVPDEAIDDAVAYVLRCYNRGYGTFEYNIGPEDRRTRAMAGVGILALAHAGRHDRAEAISAADWVLQHGFTNYNNLARFSQSYSSDRYHYGVFYCCQAMYQIGGRHWAQFFPPTARTLVANQNADGSWDAEGRHDENYGRAYTTSLVVLALGAPNQLLPIYQR